MEAARAEAHLQAARAQIVSCEAFQELTVADGPLKKFEFKKGGENFWQEPPASTATQPT